MNNDTLKILAIIPSGFCFGLQHITVDFFSYLPRKIQSHFLLTRWTNGEMEKLLREKQIPYSFSWLGMFSRKMDRLNIKMSVHALVKLPKLYYDFYRVQKKTNPDILYFANHHELILLYPLLKFTKRKVVCHMHDPSPAIPFQKKTFAHYDKVVDAYIAISENVRQRTIALGCKPEKITTIHNGISIIAHERAYRKQELCSKAGWDNDVFIIGITGQMTEKKGHLDLLAAFKIVVQENSKARLVIGGKMQEPMYSKLQHLIKESAMEKQVYFSGWIPDINSFFQNIDVFVLASRHEEGYGLVVAEAMINSLPVIITKSGGAVEIVDDGVSGYIVPKENPEAMAVKLSMLSHDPVLCMQMGKKGRKKVEEDFNMQKQVTQLADFLTSLKEPAFVR